tara:strand:- start:2218 stop:3096 length:879 start_codon:yes stop_codon:yes gene_type:complete
MEETKLDIETEYIRPELLSELTGYDYLYDMCKNVRNLSHSGSGYLNPITPRLQYIMNTLASQGIPYEFVPLDSSNGECEADNTKLANVIVTFESAQEFPLGGMVFSAHHDIANPNSENCQDNTASVCNLIHLCTLLNKVPKEELNQNVVIAFTDCEEIGGRGMNKLIEEIKDDKYGTVSNMYALELTACGDEFWITGTDSKSLMYTNLRDNIGDKTLEVVRTPYNESINASRSGLQACCIGTLPLLEMNIAKERGYCETWGLCHSLSDTFEKSANKDDMNSFVNILLNLIKI